jgi:hypothetical protein
MYLDLHAVLILSAFNKIGISWQSLREIPNVKYYYNRPGGNRAVRRTNRWMDGWMDGHDEASSRFS